LLARRNASRILEWEGEPMKAYVITTGAVFGLIALAHLARMVAEGSRLATDPFFILLTVASGALCLWAGRVLRSAK
jgi:hypothetical protein